MFLSSQLSSRGRTIFWDLWLDGADSSNIPSKPIFLFFYKRRFLSNILFMYFGGFWDKLVFNCYVNASLELVVKFFLVAW